MSNMKNLEKALRSAKGSIETEGFTVSDELVEEVKNRWMIESNDEDEKGPKGRF